jgi:chemotaxis protein MotB
MITFVDLISLMLTFMVMLFATSSIEAEAWRKTVDSLAQSLNWQGLQLPQVAARFAAQREQPPAALDLDYLAEVLHTSVTAVPSLQGVEIRREHDRLVLAIPGALLFASGSATVSPEARAALSELTPMLRGIGNRIVVEGHADPDAIAAGGAFASNWELSLARALAVADLLVATGLGRRVACYGLAESRYDELGEPDGSDRHAHARRVDLVFYASSEDED